MSKDYIAVCELENDLEVQMIETILEDNAIPHMIRLSDSVPLPVYDLTESYAKLYADEEYVDEIRELVNEMRNAAFSADDLYDDDDKPTADE